MKRVLGVSGDHPALTGAALTFAGNLLFPRFSHRMRWRTRLGLRGTVLTLAAQLGIAALFVRWAEEQRHAFEEVRRQLGREPTPLEVEAYFLARLDDS